MPETDDQDDITPLIEFLRDRDAPCPLCGYNLRGLTQPQCPECHQDLRLTVGSTKPQFLWFLVAVAPCVFAGIAAALMLIPMTMQTLSGGGTPEPLVFALNGLGWLSALGGLALIHYRFAFLRQTTGRQRAYAAAVWVINVLALLAFFFTVLILNGGP